MVKTISDETYKIDVVLPYPEMKKQTEMLKYRVGTLTKTLTEMKTDSNQYRDDPKRKLEREIVEIRATVDSLTAEINNLPVVYQTQFDQLESSSKQEILLLRKEIEQLKEKARLDAEKIKRIETQQAEMEELNRQFTQLKNMVMEHNTKIQQHDKTTIRLSNLRKNSLEHQDRPKSANDQENLVSFKECSQNNIRFRVRSANVGTTKRPFSCSDIPEHSLQIHTSTESLHQVIVEKKSNKEQSDR